MTTGEPGDTGGEGDDESVGTGEETGRQPSDERTVLGRHASPDEPTEFDPARRWPDLVPSPPAAPRTETSAAPKTEPSSSVPVPADADPELVETWWRSVVLANVAVGSAGVGVLLIGFRGMWLVGAGAVLFGLLAALRVGQHARAVTARADDEEVPDPD